MISFRQIFKETPVLEILETSMTEFEYIKALVDITNTINETVAKEEYSLYEDDNSITLMKEIRRNSLQKAAMSLCRRVCESQDMTFEETIENVVQVDNDTMVCVVPHLHLVGRDTALFDNIPNRSCVICNLVDAELDVGSHRQQFWRLRSRSCLDN